MIQTSFFPQPEKDKPVKIIQINSSGLQPRKLEELLPDDNLLLDTYVIYPTGGYHPFYGVPNTLPIYQQKIWPRVVRIKFSKRFVSKEKLNNMRKTNLRKNQTSEHVNPYWDGRYLQINLKRRTYYTRNYYTTIKKNGKHSTGRDKCSKLISIHRLVALAFIPNPENKPQVMHINDDRTNYLIENLKWGTQGENMKGTLKRRPDTMEQKYLNLVDRGIIKG